MLQLLRALSFLPMMLAMKIRREERRTVDWFRARGALDAERAVIVAKGGPIHDWIRRRLESTGALRHVGGRYYFDETGYAVFRARRRKRALIAVAAMIVAIGIGFLTGVIAP